MSRFPLRRLPRSGAVFGAAILGCWALVTGLVPLPVAQHGPTPFAGHFVTRNVLLTGAAADARPPAGASAARPLAATSEVPASATPGWSARIALSGAPQLVAFSWSDAVAGALRVRVVHSDATTGDWVDVEGLANFGPGGTPAAPRTTALSGTDPIWIGDDASAVDVVVTSGTLTDFQVQTMHWDGTLASAGAGGVPTAGAEPADPGVIARSAWDQGDGWVRNPGCTSGPIVNPTLKMAIIHHTVQANDYTPADVPMMIKADYDFHVGPQRRWCDIAYNFLVDKFGRIWQGRSGDISETIQGGHSLGFNEDTVGIALLGQYQPGAAPPAPPAAQPTYDEELATSELIAWKFGLYGIDPNGTVSYAPSTDVSPHGVHHPAGVPFTLPTIVGHQDTSATECPGAYVEALMPDFRRIAGYLLAISATPERWAPFSSPQALLHQQYRDVLLRDVSDSAAAFWINRMVTDGRSPSDLLGSLLTSNEVSRSQPPVFRLYTGLLGRVPDVGGYRFWSSQVARKHRSVIGVADALASSSEFERTYGDTTNEQFVRLLYQHVLGRSPDPGGLAYWTGRLDGGTSRGRVSVSFTDSSEYQRAVDGSVKVQMVYFDLLRRQADPGGLAYWTGRLAAGEPYQSVIAAIYHSSEYRNRVSQAS